MHWFADHEPHKPRGPLGRRLYRLAYPAVGYGPPPLNRLVLHPDLYAHLPAPVRTRLTKRLLRPGGSPWLRELVEGRVKMREGARIREVDRSNGRLKLRLDDGSQTQADRVLVAAGYRFSLDGLVLSPGCAHRLRRWPTLDRYFRSVSEPRVFFVGYAAEGVRPDLTLRARPSSPRTECGSVLTDRLIQDGPVAARGPAPASMRTITDVESLTGVEAGWDELVRAMRRPSPFMLHAWLRNWSVIADKTGQLAVQVAHRDGQLVGALPFVTHSTLRHEGRVVHRRHCARSVTLLAPGETEEMGRALVDRGAAEAAAVSSSVSPATACLAPWCPETTCVWSARRCARPDLSAGWDEVHKSKTSSKTRNCIGDAGVNSGFSSRRRPHGPPWLTTRSPTRSISISCAGRAPDG